MRTTYAWVTSAALVLAGCAQQPVQPQLSPQAGPVPAGAPAWQQGRSAAQATSPLAPVPGRLTATPPNEIHVDRLKVPPGFRIELWAHGMPGIRAMARADNGKIYAGTRGIGRVYEITDNGRERTSRVFVDKLNQPAVAYNKGTLYVMAIDKALRYDGIDANPNAQPVDMTAVFKLPPEQHHNWKYLRFGPDGKLYVPFGAPCNICMVDEPYAQLRRYNPDGSGMEVIARGIRNTQGFDWHPATGELWFTDHGRDWLGDDGPEDELNRMSRTGLNFGFPYCHANGIADPDVRKPNACDGVTLPVRTMGPHAAVMGLEFYRGNMFPPEYRNAMFVARKGSWNRTKKFGYDVVMVKTDPAGRSAEIVPFVTGFMDPATDQMWGRPVYFLQMPDGSMLLSDEQVGAIYRISYAR
ncbi:PQQ-dependent sugar dehydrogenase [Ramlibacter albus]|uniref:PQQ-dependent sugar dehydrogenase n=1 Tax=Ramlibacter albus TaxID=2079448 RepID=A0A923S4W7_9BURK|nr:PQQ-dependent sugar dehydrogenase [Ramlibacter albus]MBC5767318.1 PQQ-dependent sugar dehydrogenase [Ramlibacter albus]